MKSSDKSAGSSTSRAGVRAARPKRRKPEQPGSSGAAGVRKWRDETDSLPLSELLGKAIGVATSQGAISQLHGGLKTISVTVSDAGGRSISIQMEGWGNSYGAGGELKAHACDHWIGLDQPLSLLERSIDGLDLAPNTLAAAQSLQSQFPDDVTFTSGRRDVASQCKAMAQNVVSTGDRQWIGKTYIAGAELQAWVDQHPNATTVADISAGLQSVMASWDDAKKSRISRHLGGAAFDLVPIAGAQGQKVKKAIAALPHFNKFLDGESGVNVWHAQFDE